MQEFVKCSIPVIIFFIIGDFVTTEIGLQYGFVEANPIMNAVVTNWVLFLGVKLLIIPFLYVIYRMKPNQIYFIIPTVAGIILIINNLYRIGGV